MKKFYDKHELGFALIWIVLYVNLMSMADNASRALGMEKLISFPVTLVMSLVLLFWLRRHGLFEKYGLCAPKFPPRQFLYYLPLVLIVSCNAWLGLRMNMSAAESILYVLSMLCVGFLEEIIFRGLVLSRLKRGLGRVAAIIVSALIFGWLHGVPLAVAYATVLGLVFGLLTERHKSILPTVVCHIFFNATSFFLVTEDAFLLLSLYFLSIVVLFVGSYILFKKDRIEE